MTEAEKALADLISGLTLEVAELTKQVKDLATKTRRSHASAVWQRVISLGMIVAIVIGGYGIYQNHLTSRCINTNLGARSAPGIAQTAAALAVAQALAKSTRAQNATSGALFVLLNAPKAEQAADYKTFLAAFANGQVVAGQTQTALDTYVIALADVQKAQAAHPLGLC